MDMKEVLLRWFTNFSKKASSGAAKNENMSNQELAKVLYKTIVRKFEKRKVYSSFKNNISGTDFASMRLISKFNKGFRFLWCIIDIYSEHEWVAPLKDKKVITITNSFQKVLNEYGRKPNKIWIDKSSELYTPFTHALHAGIAE